MNWELKIKRVNNGYVVSYPDTLDDDTEVAVEEVFEFNKDEHSMNEYKTDDEEKLALGSVLDFVAEHFGNLYDKYGKENLNITFDKKGHKID